MINNEIGYTGQVTVTAVHGKKKVKSATFHNKGTGYLFKFLCYCLAGEFSAASNMRPQKIQLFHNNSTDLDNPSELLSALEERSAKIKCNTDAVIKDETVDGKAKYSVTLHFRIPYAFLTGNNINHAVLFDAYDNECAHFSFIHTNDDETKSWEYLTNGLNQDYTLVIEWKMIINNQNEGAN